MKHAFAFLILLLSSLATAAESYRELYVKPSATNASNINGGSSVDRKFQRTNGQWNSSTRVFTSTGDTLDSAWIGEVACVIADGGTTGAYFAEVTAVDNTAKTITLSSSLTVGTAPSTSATARTITIGGAWAGMSGATTFPAGGSTAFSGLATAPTLVRINYHGDYSLTSRITMSSAGFVHSGYSTTPGDGGMSKWQFDGSGDTDVINFSGSSIDADLRNIWFRNQSTSAVKNACRGMLFNPTSGSLRMTGCRLSDCPQEGIYAGAFRITLINCEVYNCLASGSPGSGSGAVYLSSNTAGMLSLLSCCVHDCPNGVAAIYSAGPISMRDTVVDTANTGVYCNAARTSISNCVFYNCTNGTDIGQLEPLTGCVFSGCSNVAKLTSSSARNWHYGCAYYNNTAKVSGSGKILEHGTVDLTADPFVDAANGDFRTRLTPLRNAIDGTLLQSSDYYSKSTRRRVDIGIGPSNPYQIGQSP